LESVESSTLKGTESIVGEVRVQTMKLEREMVDEKSHEAVRVHSRIPEQFGSQAVEDFVHC
jgi:hypothetical protein